MSHMIKTWEVGFKEGRESMKKEIIIILKDLYNKAKLHPYCFLIKNSIKKELDKLEE